MSVLVEKNWDVHVIHAEAVSRGAGFQELRDRIVELADPQAGETAVDVGSGTGLLSLALADRGLKVWAVDVSPAMGEYLRAKASSAGLDAIEPVVASAVSLPLVDECADVVVSNYCFHHLADEDKATALAEVRRVLRPGGRVVFGDMMFGLSVGQTRDRHLLVGKVRGLVSLGPAGVVRVIKNALRILFGRWEKPARADWWRQAMRDNGFEEVVVVEMEHEGGIASGRRR